MRQKVAVFVALLLFRIINAHFVQTFFQPDEYFQALEPAWQIAFGPQSGAWITWEWKEQLRTSVHPYLFAAAYRAMDWLCHLWQADAHVRANALGAAPRLVQACFAASMDYLTWRMAGQVYGARHAATRWALAVTVCTTAFYLRPTNIIIWASISAVLVWRGRSFRRASILAQGAAVAGFSALAVFVAADRLYYNTWAIPPLRFLYLNLVQNLATFYGQNRVDYYFTEGLPLLLTTALPFALLGLYQSFMHGQSSKSTGKVISFTFGVATVATVLAFSAISHKEVRFIYPLLPILHVLAARPLASFFDIGVHNKVRSVILVCALAANVLIAYYVSLVHQRGVVDVMHYLRHRQESWIETAATGELTEAVPANITVGFLMPCHSTPWRSHLVYPGIDAWALTCEPPVNLSPQERLSYLDEADVFYADPVKWLNNNMQDRGIISGDLEADAQNRLEQIELGSRKWPHYLVVFEQLLPTLQPLLVGTRYKECRRFFNTHWHDDHRRKGDVVVYCMRR
ncbi:glycosyltransferase family 22 protein [Pseudocercospora fijiensis CIRAD86]|uniref:Mannosyltransferase n=1 Tax=Pseudocercospora fijiensis (strain CIRAD86) TaxID=383855 RepID=M2Z310_PSEFD|nr:glycosyltransferase family 22 protein [Pseudocercospora fijiensis CIRAD86]EME84225.1 glycosyltransferase family 22 protein [Pseudocercospora fijiensis CIRAD86]